MEITVFRIVQEAVNNARRHGAARHVNINVSAAGDSLEVAIGDDGVGFDVEAAQRRSREGGGIGLPGMQERVELLGGHLGVDAAPGKGTKIRAVLPLTV